ncbi:LPXTG cell wall anchor domain-containing protein [Streptomyces sp. NRRL S-118]|uniref:LPXTG cell wall anchor domain-containing protein n=1 Tax=Streptomyces sp. NRRL S-118 TaxID=1463881 RepID=UPI0004C47B95|nr:LPXTG cell wall anchor domain-containing protein [Streptomyces sp. NRRL S-118]
MKLRRAMAVAAATAVIAPAAFLAAPAAYATEGTTSTTSSGTTEGQGSTTPDTTTPDTTTPDTPETSDDTKPAEGTDPADDAEPAAEGDKPADDTKPAEGDKPADEKPATDDKPAAEKPAEDAEPGNEEMPPYCEELDESFQEAALEAEISGLPGKIVAGSGWEEFTLTVSNKGKVDLKEVVLYAEIENYELDPSKFLSPYVDLQFRLPDTGEWVTIGDKELAGDYFWSVETMKSNDFVKADLRVSIDKNAPAGDSYSFGSGAYLGDVKGQECIAETGTEMDFTVLKPGSSNPDPGEAKPGEGKPEGKPGPDTKPQGEAKPLPVTGNLAETGSSSMLPTIGLAGGIAIVAGAGVVFALKRRNGGSAA